MRISALFVARLLLALLGVLSVSAHAQVEGVGSAKFGLVVGSDDRQIVDQAWLAAHPRYAPLVDAVGLFVRSAPSGTNTCTATYVGGGLAVTAGHCVDAGAYESHGQVCDDIQIKWGFRVDQASYLTSNCLRIIAAKNIKPTDYAILEIWPLPRAEIRAVHNAGSGTGVTSPGVMFSHPKGGALKFSGPCYMPPYATGIGHECDSEPGSSGALLLEDSTLQAVAIHYGDTGVLNAAVYLGHSSLGDIMDARFKPKGRLVSVGGKCLDVRDGSSQDRTPIQLWSCSDSDEQEWTVSPYGAVLGLAGKCLDVPQTTPGNRPWLFGCHYGSNQMWRLENVELRVAATICLDVPGIAPGNSTRAQIWRCHGGDGQKWTWTERHELRNKQGRCLDAASFTPSDGTPVVVYDCHGGANQMWDLSGGGQVRGIGGYCLDIPNGNFANGTQLQMHECNGETAQTWSINGQIRTGDGTCLAAPRVNPTDGALPAIEPCGVSPRQRWIYFP